MALLVSELKYTVCFTQLKNDLTLEDVELYLIDEDISSCTSDEEINRKRSFKINSLEIVTKDLRHGRNFSKTFNFSYLFEPGKDLNLKVVYFITMSGIKNECFTFIKNKIGTEYWKETRMSINIF